MGSGIAIGTDEMQNECSKDSRAVLSSYCEKRRSASDRSKIKVSNGTHHCNGTEMAFEVDP